MTERDERLEIVIIGGGPAGLTAAAYWSWLGLKIVVLEAGVIGRRASQASRIENFPGFEDGIRGTELAAKMTKQSTRLGASMRTSEEVIGLDIGGEVKKVTSRRKTYRTSAIIISTGTQRRKLRVPGEAGFLGRGVSYCVVCDGPFFKNLAVANVGGGQEALTDALFLADLAKSVTMVTHEKESMIRGNFWKSFKASPMWRLSKGSLSG